MYARAMLSTPKRKILDLEFGVLKILRLKWKKSLFLETDLRIFLYLCENNISTWIETYMYVVCAHKFFWLLYFFTWILPSWNLNIDFFLAILNSLRYIVHLWIFRAHIDAFALTLLKIWIRKVVYTAFFTVCLFPRCIHLLKINILDIQMMEIRNFLVLHFYYTRHINSAAYYISILQVSVGTFKYVRKRIMRNYKYGHLLMLYLFSTSIELLERFTFLIIQIY